MIQRAWGTCPPPLRRRHKWCCTPKGSAFLWCGSPALQRSLLPLVTSHGAGLGWQGEWLWGGTADPSAWLAVPTSLAVLEALGWERVHDYTHGLVRRAAQLLVEQWPGHELMVVGGEGPGGDVASMLAVSLPPLEGFAADAQGASRLHDALRDGHGIEVCAGCVRGVHAGVRCCPSSPRVWRWPLVRAGACHRRVWPAVGAAVCVRVQRAGRLPAAGGCAAAHGGHGRACQAS